MISRFSKCFMYVLILPTTFLSVSCQSDSGGTGGTVLAPSGSNQFQSAELRNVLTYDREDLHSGVLVTTDVMIPMRDGFNLTCDLYQPSGADGKIAEGQFPVIVKDLTGYGRKEVAEDGLTDYFVQKGYKIGRAHV